mmetsp:Transcript_76535/g.234277  ORF Transcript_76535/g.234277 Transcript_76535/m.234277 type:complete len:152 (-) Transcript_76535:96-551(-)|eukprot:CAMPEP_0198535818 /NCGR_PEP_ID=MMETSP1462-20131121/39915_1 /TAXON_ID=1333877 /ORGANISM="Brandtodinium nutriculum, Strain RCC3387" /LENGTH=151 /DNA_ID=CAMNT_0044265763 /DNA_START=83 /DNA_END=538 /DNA_ORIENTATION=+
MANAMDFAVRVCESIGFGLHSVLGITEPCTGALRGAFRDDRGSLPLWFWPVAGLLLAVVALANFSGKDEVVLGAQAYIATFHIGAMLWHRRLNHHPVAVFAPSIYVLFAIIVTTLRVNFWTALLGTVAAAAVAELLCRILVTPPEKDALLG